MEGVLEEGAVCSIGCCIYCGGVLGSVVGDEFEIVSLIAIKYLDSIRLCDIIKLL